jgi:hypothetical protein
VNAPTQRRQGVCSLRRHSSCFSQTKPALAATTSGRPRRARRPRQHLVESASLIPGRIHNACTRGAHTYSTVVTKTSVNRTAQIPHGTAQADVAGDAELSLEGGASRCPRGCRQQGFASASVRGAAHGRRGAADAPCCQHIVAPDVQRFLSATPHHEYLWDGILARLLLHGAERLLISGRVELLYQRC